MGIFRGETAGQAIARGKQEKLGQVKEQYPEHAAKKKEEEGKWKEKVRQWKAYRNRLIESKYRVKEKAYLEAKKESEGEEYRKIEYDPDTDRYHNTSKRGKLEGAADSKDEKEKRWKQELWNAIRKEYGKIVAVIESGGEEEIREILQKGFLEHFNDHEVAEIIRDETGEG